MPEKRQRVGYLTFGRDDFAYGLALSLSELTGSELYRVTPRTALLVDWLIFSCFWWEHIYVLADFLRAAGISKDRQPRPKIIIGGFNTANPAPFLPYADYVAVGDGEGVLRGIIESDRVPANILTDQSRSVEYGIASMHPFCHETNDVARIEIARGCPAHCRFCAVSWLKPYRELDFEGIKEAIKTTRRKRLSLFAPEPTLHSQDERLTALCHNYGKIRIDSDVRLDRLDKRSDSVPRVGIEGLSERLRASVGKPYRNERILSAIRKAIEEGRRGLFMYMILDLPGETDDDWEEFRGLCRSIGELPGARDFVLKPSPSVFLPTPHTPMESEGIHWDRDYAGQWERFFGRGEDREWQVIMAERSRVFSPGMRILSMVSARAGEEFREFERLATANKAISVSAGRPVVRNTSVLLKCLERFGGVDHYCGPRAGGPWQIVQRPMTREREMIPV